MVESQKKWQNPFISFCCVFSPLSKKIGKKISWDDNDGEAYQSRNIPPRVNKSI
jgi:hypothetical protein